MDFNQLESFLAISRYKSFSKAAESLFLTQPALSNHIARLERELDVILLERSSRKTELTEAGRLFFSAAQDLLNHREQVVAKMRNYRDNIEGELSIGASSIPAQYLLPPILARFSRDYPQVICHIHDNSSQELEELLLSKFMDFGLVGSPPLNPELVYEKIASDELVVITPARAPFLERDSICLDELLEHRLVLREDVSGTRKAFEDALAAHGGNYRVRPALYVGNTDMVNLCVEQGMGLSVTSHISAKDAANLGKLHIMHLSDLPIYREFHFVYLRGRVLAPRAQLFRDYVLNRK
ncbi:MAG: selenium metabolism-associated LysR family transcriptional regulator [Bacillota bacterium]|nr:selenium metabolism-associated LysR family transcriptional regulator [Bacillota bacterium]